MHASSHMLYLVETHARPPAGASRPAASATTTSGADDANDRTPGSTPADAVGDARMKNSTVDGKQPRRLCAATDAEKHEARVASHGVERRGDAQHVPAAEQSPQQQQAAVRLQRVVRGHVRAVRLRLLRRHRGQLRVLATELLSPMQPAFIFAKNKVIICIS